VQRYWPIFWPQQSAAGWDQHPVQSQGHGRVAVIINPVIQSVRFSSPCPALRLLARESPLPASHALIKGTPEALHALQRLPDTNEITYRLYVLENIHRGQQDAVREPGLYTRRIFYGIKPDNLIEVLGVIHKRHQLEPEVIP
jgi:hypothetical protein